MNFDQLKTFHQVAQTGSFTLAAGELFLTQPAVSQQIKALNSFWGLPFFLIEQTGPTYERRRNPLVLYGQAVSFI